MRGDFVPDMDLVEEPGVMLEVEKPDAAVAGVTLVDAHAEHERIAGQVVERGVMLHVDVSVAVFPARGNRQPERRGEFEHLLERGHHRAHYGSSWVACITRRACLS
jgi:hypothetical protein